MGVRKGETDKNNKTVVVIGKKKVYMNWIRNQKSGIRNG